MFSLPFKKLRHKEDNTLSRVHSATSANSKKSKPSFSLGRRLSLWSNSFDSDASEIEELQRFTSLNQERFPSEVLHYLRFQGLSTPRIVIDGPVGIAMASSGDTVFLPSVAREEQYETSLLNPVLNDAPRSNDISSARNQNRLDSRSGENLTEDHAHHMQSTSSDEAVAHTLAFVISLDKPTPITTIKAQLRSTCTIMWPKGMPNDHNIKKESFELGQLSWDLSLANYNYYVPQDEEAIEDEEFDNAKFLTQQRIPTKTFEQHSTELISKGSYVNAKREQDPFVLNSLNTAGSVSFPSGTYIFLLPVQWTSNLSESLMTMKACVKYQLRSIVVTKGKQYTYGEHDINVIRGPPLLGMSTADKPVYINKVWSDSLNYEISFPKKYVTLGEELPLKIKLTPLDKGVQVKRIKVKIIEKVTYVSKNLGYEYDEETVEYDDGYYKTVKKDKALLMFELKCKLRQSSAIRDVVVSSQSDNLLAMESVVAPLQVECYIPFVRPHKLAKQVPWTDKQMIQSVFYTEKHNRQVDHELGTLVKNNDVAMETDSRVLEHVEGLYPESSINRYISIEHKLQVSVRISRMESQSSKVHHYEVMIDTPLYFLNSQCVPDSVELPEYHGDTRLPTFEEATSRHNSPMMMPSSVTAGDETVNYLSRASTMGIENIDSLMNEEMPDIGRRVSVTKSELLNNFRRMSRHESTSVDSLGAPPPAPPMYEECQPFLSGESSSSSLSLSPGSGDEDREAVDEGDIADEFKIAAFRGH